MGFLWDLIQHEQIGTQKRRTEMLKSRSNSLERRIALLERDLDATRELLQEVVARLEQRLGEDFDGDGRVG
jgi:chaperonin cofactor prefoldin